ncbi:MAG: MobC family plasmid mobilization relaxosome protein [Lachnospiraceae bacterium]|nr:MobC family plasmid mobilization relaxosome protein [Lachnospiraceae bacterium]
MSDKNYSVRKTLRLTPEQAQMLAYKSKEANMSEAEYLRLMISQKPKDYPKLRGLCKELINEINRIGVNINQIVYNHNCDFYSTDDKLRLISYLKSITKAVKEVTEKWQ